MSCQSTIPVTTTIITPITIAIAWSAVSGSTGYQVEYRENDPAVTSWTLLPTQTTTSSLIGSLMPATEYLMRVNTFCPTGNCYSVTILNSTL